MFINQEQEKRASVQESLRMADLRVLVRGGGDLASGVIQALYRTGVRVLVTEVESPSVIRHTVAVAHALFQDSKKAQVEDITAMVVQSPAWEEHTSMRCIKSIWEQGAVPILVDPKAECVAWYRPHVIIDAIIAKKNLGTTCGMAPLVIACGPGFTAGADCDIVIETMRGHRLGNMILEGEALPNTGTPGMIAGHAADRVVYAPAGGCAHPYRHIGDFVQEGELLLGIREEQGSEYKVYAPFSGLVRGMIADAYPVHEGLKIADIDPRREEKSNCFTISDKARAIGNAVVTAMLYGLVERGIL